MSPNPAALAATKFIPPHVPQALVPRPRLLDRLDAGAAGPLTLLAASAGAGKSALLSTWLAERAVRPAAWLALDAGDADPRRFWRGVLEALGRADVGESVASLVMHPGEPAELIMPALVNALDALDEPIVLVIDDLHEIGDSAAVDDLDRLLRRPPEALRIVAATRADPALRLGRMRVAGELTEIRAADLAFTLAEAEQLLLASGIDVPPAVAQQLWERTEGWAAGLRLAALALRAHPEPDRFVAEFAGDDSTVADYLLAEVLVQQPPDLRDFLLRISIADRVNGELADALTGRSDSERVLAQLERDHALLSSTGGARTWHRLHPLFAELLRSELRFSAPDDLPALHSRAAWWFHEHRRPSHALRHAAAAEDWRLVGELAGAHWVPMLLDGELGSLRPVVEDLPLALAADEPELALAVAGVYVDAGDDARAEHWFSLALAGRDRVPFDRRGNFDLAVAAVALLRGRLRGDIDAALYHAQSMVERDDDGALAEMGGDDLRAFALCQLGTAELWAGHLDRARRDLEAARGAALASDRDWMLVQCLAYLGVHAMMTGRYARAVTLSEEAERLAESRGWSGTWLMGVTAGTLSSVAFHRNDLDLAERHERRAAERLRHSGDRPLRAVIALQRARLDAAQGRADPALEALEEARQWLRDWPILSAITGLIDGLEATVLASLGEHSRIGGALATEAADGNHEAAVALAQLALQAGDPAGVLTILGPHLTQPGSPFASTLTEAWTLAAMAHDALADHRSAGSALERALEHAERGGLRRPFVSHGGAIAPLLRRQQRTGTSHRALLDALLETVDQPAAVRSPALLPETLSDREAAVLRFLPTMMSNQEIANELFVSVNTVKTHLKAIYRKLDVDDRRGAVRRARDLALLGPS